LENLECITAIVVAVFLIVYVRVTFISGHLSIKILAPPLETIIFHTKDRISKCNNVTCNNTKETHCKALRVLILILFDVVVLARRILILMLTAVRIRLLPLPASETYERYETSPPHQ